LEFGGGVAIKRGETMDYQQTLDYIYSFADYETKRLPRSAVYFDLRRMDELMNRLGKPHRSIPAAHIAGTNGKGSTAAMIAAVMQTAGYRVGLNISPHMIDVRERITVNGEMITQAEFIELAERLQPIIEDINSKAEFGRLTTFEILTGMAFAHFKRKSASFQVLEVGMGGRLDATNIVIPEACVITSISLDHTEVLGKTLEEIAEQKAGIIKPGVPVVTLPQEDSAMAVLERACEENGCKLIKVGKDVSGFRGAFTADGQQMVIGGQVDEYIINLPLLGHFQLDNTLGAVAALETLADKGFRISKSDIVDGLAQVKWPGRFNILHKNPYVIVDGGHNPGAAARLRQSLEAYFGLGAGSGRTESIKVGKAVLVIGASFDKDVENEIKELAPVFKQVIITRANHPRAAFPEVLEAEFHKLGIIPMITENVPAALDAALRLAGKDDLICATGSLFIVGETLDYFNQRALGSAAE